MAIKKDDVFRVADEMFADGVSPSLVAIRSKLGSGSFSTISGFLAEWKSASRTAPVQGDEEVPEEVQDVFAPALRSMWAMAQAQALQENDKIQKDCAALLAAAALRESEALDLAQVLQAENDQFIQKLMLLQGQLDSLQLLRDSDVTEHRATRAVLHELQKVHTSLLSKIRPISLRKDRGSVPGVKAK